MDIAFKSTGGPPHGEVHEEELPLGFELKNLSSLVPPPGHKDLNEFFVTEAIDLGSLVMQTAPLIGRGLARQSTQFIRQKLLTSSNSSSSALLKRVGKFKDHSCQKLDSQKIDPVLLKAKNKMIQKSRRDWKIRLKPDNPLHFLAGIFSDFHDSKVIRLAYRQVAEIKKEVLKSISPNDAPKKKLQILYQAIQTRFPYKIMGDLFKGLQQKRLDCDTVAMMALFVGHELGWNLKMVYSPGHAFIRWDDCGGIYVNMDLNSTGSKPDSHYAEDIKKVSIQTGAYLQSLSPQELIGHFLLLKADELKGVQRDREALKFYNLANKYAPKNHFVLLNRSMLLYSMDKLELGHQDLIAARKLVPDLATYVTQANENFRHKKYHAAEQNLIQAFSLKGPPPFLKGIKDPKNRVFKLLGEMGGRYIDHGVQSFKKDEMGAAKKDFQFARQLFAMLPTDLHQPYFEKLLKLRAYHGMVSYRHEELINAQMSFMELNELGGQIKSKQGKATQAFKRLQEKTYAYQGYIAFHLKEYSQAKNLLEKARALEPNNPEIENYLVKTYLQLHDYQGAKEIFQKVAAANPNDIEIQMIFGKILLDNQDYVQAEYHFQNLAKQHPELLEGKNNLAWAKSRNSWRGAKDAIPIFQKVLELDPNNVNALLGLGQMYFLLRDYPQADSFFKKILNHTPRDKEARFWIGRIALANKKYSQAKKIFLSLYQDNPKEINYWKGLAQTFFRLDKHSEVLNLADQILDRDPKDIEAFSLKGWTLYQLGQDDLAENYFNMVLDINLESKKRRAGVFRTSKLSREMCFADTEDDWSAIYGLGMIHFKRGEYDKAKRYLSSALHLRPNDPELLADYKRLKAKTKVP